MGVVGVVKCSFLLVGWGIVGNTFWPGPLLESLLRTEQDRIGIALFCWNIRIMPVEKVQERIVQVLEGGEIG